MNPNSKPRTSGSATVSFPVVRLTSDQDSPHQTEREYQQLWNHFLSRSAAGERQYLTRENYPVRLVELLVLTGIISIGLVLIRNFDLVGSLICFLLATLFSLVSGSLIRGANQVRFWNQTLWGILIPIASVIGDPFVLGTYQSGVPISLREQSCPGPYFVIAISIVALVFSWFLRPESNPWMNAMVAGLLRCSAGIMFLIGFALLPIAALGSLSLLGLVALVPWIAGAIYYRTSRMHAEWAWGGGKSQRFAFLLGMVGVGLPFIGLMILGSMQFFSRFTAY